MLRSLALFLVASSIVLPNLATAESPINCEPRVGLPSCESYIPVVDVRPGDPCAGNCGPSGDPSPPPPPNNCDVDVYGVLCLDPILPLLQAAQDAVWGLLP